MAVLRDKKFHLLPLLILIVPSLRLLSKNRKQKEIGGQHHRVERKDLGRPFKGGGGGQTKMTRFGSQMHWYPYGCPNDRVEREEDR